MSKEVSTQDAKLKKRKIYLIGSLRNPEVPKMAQEIRKLGFDVFDDWYAAGERADDSWKEYEISRGHNYREALSGYAADHVFDFDNDLTFKFVGCIHGDGNDVDAGLEIQDGCFDLVFHNGFNRS